MHSSGGLVGWRVGGELSIKHVQNLWCTALPLRVEPEGPLSDEGIGWIVGRSTDWWALCILRTADSWTGVEAAVSRGSGNKTIETVRLNVLPVSAWVYTCRESLIFWKVKTMWPCYRQVLTCYCRCSWWFSVVLGCRPKCFYAIYSKTIVYGVHMNLQAYIFRVVSSFVWIIFTKIGPEDQTNGQDCQLFWRAVCVHFVAKPSPVSWSLIIILSLPTDPIWAAKNRWVWPKTTFKAVIQQLL